MIKGAPPALFLGQKNVEFLSEGAASKGEEKMCIYVIKGDQTPLIDHKYSPIYQFPFLKDIVQKPF